MPSALGLRACFQHDTLQLSHVGRITPHSVDENKEMIGRHKDATNREGEIIGGIRRIRISSSKQGKLPRRVIRERVIFLHGHPAYSPITHRPKVTCLYYILLQRCQRLNTQ